MGVMRIRLFAGEQAIESGLPAGESTLQAEPFANFRSALREALSFLRISHQAIQSPGQSGDVLRRNQNSVDTVADDLSRTLGTVEAHHGKAARHRFRQSHAEALKPRREHEHVGGEKLSEGIGNRAGEMNPRADFERVSLRLQRGKKRSLTVDGDVPIGVAIGNGGESGKQKIESLLRDQPSHGDDSVPCSRWPLGRGAGGQVDGIGNTDAVYAADRAKSVDCVLRRTDQQIGQGIQPAERIPGSSDFVQGGIGTFRNDQRAVQPARSKNGENVDAVHETDYDIGIGFADRLAKRPKPVEIAIERLENICGKACNSQALEIDCGMNWIRGSFLAVESKQRYLMTPLSPGAGQDRHDAFGSSTPQG